MKIDSKIIKQLRLIRGLTQEQLAHFCGCSERTIIRVENKGICSLETLNALAAVFGVKINHLIGKENIEQFQQETEHGEQYLIRLYTGKMVVETFSESLAYKINYEIPRNSDDAELISNAIQEIKDWGEIWNDLDIGEQIKAAYRISELISELEVNDLLLFGLKTNEKLKILSNEIEGFLCHLHICYKDNDNIVVFNPDNCNGSLS